jgi:hypothetical protein
VGFRHVAWQTVTQVGTSPSALDAARGLIEGNPISAEIMQRRPEALADIKNAVARNLAGQLADRPVRCTLRALVFTAQKGPV